MPDSFVLTHQMPLPDIPDSHKDLSYTDQDLTFLLHVYKHLDRTDWCLGNLRKHFPEARVVVISDGDKDPGYMKLVDKHRIEFQCEDERTMLLSNRALFLKKRIEYFLENPTKYLIKLDNDTAVYRRFNYIPTYDVFGTLVYGGFRGVYFVHGGCVGCSLDAAREIRDSEILDWPDLAIVPWPREGHEDSTEEEPELMSEDQTFTNACHELELTIGPWPEVKCVSNAKVLNTRKLRYAVTHPVKDMIL